MSILADSEILRAHHLGRIVIEPWDEKNLGPNSYDVHLGPTLKTYYARYDTFGDQIQIRRPRDVAVEEPGTNTFQIPNYGFVLEPGKLYLASTLEYTETHGFVPYLDGTSSVGRHGIFIHATAGRGDSGFCGYWTLELSSVEPVRIYAGMPIGQLTYHTVAGEVRNPYDSGRHNYQNKDPEPQPSKLWKKIKRGPA